MSAMKARFLIAECSQLFPVKEGRVGLSKTTLSSETLFKRQPLKAK